MGWSAGLATYADAPTAAYITAESHFLPYGFPAGMVRIRSFEPR